MSSYAGMAEVILRGAAARSVLLRRAGQFLLASQIDRLAAEVSNQLSYISGSRNVGDLIARLNNLPGGNTSRAPLSASYSPAELRQYMTAGKQIGLTQGETEQAVRDSIRQERDGPSGEGA